jgi:uncharacterized protein (DUF2336 family)
MSLTLLRSRLTDADVRRLARGENIKERAIAAQKICIRITEGGLTPEERGAADEVLRIMAADAAALVRRALATTLKNSPHLPRDVAQRLAEDIDEIAIPIIESSPVFTEDDLIAIVRAGSAMKQIAVAGRAEVPAAVADEIVDHGAEEAVATLARNDGARLDADAMGRALTRFGSREAVTEALIDRSMLPPMISERLVSLISDEALQRLARRHALPPQLAVELAEGARERATIDVLDQAGRAVDMRRFVQQLQLNGRLTPSLMMRGLCLGHIGFFEHAIAELAGVPHGKAWVLIHDAGPLGLRAVFERTGAPARLYAPIRAAIDIYHQLELDGLPGDRDRFSRTMIERLLSRSTGLSRDETDYLLEKLDALTAAHESDTARRLKFAIGGGARAPREAAGMAAD